MAQIISQKDPITGKRTQIGSVEGRTIEERQSNLVNAFGISKREANQLSGDDIAAKLTGPISTTSLSAQPSFNIQTQPPSTAVKGLLGQFEASGDQFSQQLQQQADVSQQRETTAFESLFKELAGQATPAQLTADAYKKDVDPLTKEVTGLNNQLLAEQHALRRQKEAIEKNPEGMLRSQVNSELERAERESLRKQADIAVVLQAKQGMLTDAKATADRAVEAEVAFQQKKIDLLQLNYNRNKFLFDKDEQRNFENQQAERQRKLENEEYRLRAQFDQKIKQSDPLYQLQIQKTQKELQLLGQETPTERAKREKEDAAALKEAQASLPIMRDKIDLVDVLKQHPGMAGTVGAYGLSRFTPFTLDKSARQEFLGGVQKLVGGMTLDNLISAKERGATFGALSDAELSILAASASAINTWAIRDKNGQIIGYEIGEAEFKKELDNIQNLTRRAMELSGASLIADDEDALLDQLYQEVAPLNPASYY